MDGLNPAQEKVFHQALLSAFPDYASLAQMVKFELGETLAALTDGANQNKTVFDVLQWARSTGRTGELLAAALKANPGNPELRAFSQQFDQPRSPDTRADVSTGNRNPSLDTRAGDSTGNGNPPERGFSEQIDKRHLRSVLINKYPTFGELNILCDNLTQALEGNGRNVVVSVARVGGATLEETALNLISFLDRRSVLHYLLAEVRREFPNSI